MKHFFASDIVRKKGSRAEGVVACQCRGGDVLVNWDPGSYSESGLFWDNGGGERGRARPGGFSENLCWVLPETLVMVEKGRE